MALHNEEAFSRELNFIINKYSIDASVNIPDYALTEYILGMLKALKTLNEEIYKHSSIR